jgi:hypothetical protein
MYFSLLHSVQTDPEANPALNGYSIHISRVKTIGAWSWRITFIKVNLAISVLYAYETPYQLLNGWTIFMELGILWHLNTSQLCTSYFPVHINTVQLPQEENVKYLGLHLDRRLNPARKHMSSILGYTLTGDLTWHENICQVSWATPLQET